MYYCLTCLCLISVGQHFHSCISLNYHIYIYQHSLQINSAPTNHSFRSTEYFQKHHSTSTQLALYVRCSFSSSNNRQIIRIIIQWSSRTPPRDAQHYASPHIHVKSMHFILGPTKICVNKGVRTPTCTQCPRSTQQFSQIIMINMYDSPEKISS